MTPTASRASIAEVLARHSKSYNTDRSGVGYVICRCGIELKLDGASTADDAKTFAAHQAIALSDALRIHE